MQLKIPKELMQYVKMDKVEGLVHLPSMPKELLPLFEETRKIVINKQQQRKTELEKLLIPKDGNS